MIKNSLSIAFVSTLLLLALGCDSGETEHLAEERDQMGERVAALEIRLTSVEGERDTLREELDDARKLAAVLEYYLAAVDFRFRGEDVAPMLAMLRQSVDDYGDDRLTAAYQALPDSASTGYGGEAEAHLLTTLRLLLEIKLLGMEDLSP